VPSTPTASISLTGDGLPDALGGSGRWLLGDHNRFFNRSRLALSASKISATGAGTGCVRPASAPRPGSWHQLRPAGSRGSCPYTWRARSGSGHFRRPLRAITVGMMALDPYENDKRHRLRHDDRLARHLSCARNPTFPRDRQLAYPLSRWWKKNPVHHREERTVRFALIVSIRLYGTIEIYAPVRVLMTPPIDGELGRCPMSTQAGSGRPHEAPTCDCALCRRRANSRRARPEPCRASTAVDRRRRRNIQMHAEVEKSKRRSPVM
jgi:hypothetical protein